MAVQRPQCTQVRSTALEAAISGSRNCSAVNRVCIAQRPRSRNRWVRGRHRYSASSTSGIAIASQPNTVRSKAECSWKPLSN